MSLVDRIVGQRPRSPLSSRSAWHRQPVRSRPRPVRKGRAVGRLRRAHRVGVVAVNAGAPYTPAAGAKDLRAVLFNWMWHQGMLKGTDERDMVATLEYQAKGGTIQVDGQPCTLSKFRESTNYQTFSQRIQYTCTRPNKQTVLEHRSRQLAVRVERGHARRGDRWNERQGCGDAGGRAGAAHSHLGQSAGRSEVRAGGDHGHVEAGRQPGHGDRRRRDEGRQYVSVVGRRGQAGADLPDPRRSGATGTATLDAKYMTEKVVVTQGATTTEFTYSNYQDWNNPLNKIEVFYAGRLIERKNGAVVRDLTTSETETGNVYVVAPVPPSVQKAMNVTAKAPTIVWAKPEPPTNTTAPTPRIGGHPDLTGNWAEFNMLDWQLRQPAMRSDAGEPCNRQSIRPRISSSTHLRGSACWLVLSTSRSTGTRFSSSTCGPTRKIPS